MTRTLVLGLGNPLMGDDGAGLEALARLREDYALPAAVRTVDGGTWGMNLLPMLEAAERVIILDAIDTRSAPGTLTVLERHELPRYFAHKLSPHQIDLREVLALAEWRGALPDQIVAIGIQPARIEMREGLSDEVGSRLGPLVELAVARLTAFGHHCPARELAVHA